MNYSHMDALLASDSKREFDLQEPSELLAKLAEFFAGEPPVPSSPIGVPRETESGAAGRRPWPWQAPSALVRHVPVLGTYVRAD